MRLEEINFALNLVILVLLVWVISLHFVQQKLSLALKSLFEEIQTKLKRLPF